MLAGFSRKTTSSPRRKTSTSFALKRNSLGNRTAWLLPERNTLAVVMTNPPMYKRKVYTCEEASASRVSYDGLDAALAQPHAVICWNCPAVPSPECAPVRPGEEY